MQKENCDFGNYETVTPSLAFKQINIISRERSERLQKFPALMER